jgi:hypothetical protein
MLVPSLPAKFNVCVVVVGDKICYLRTKILPYRIWEQALGRQSIKRWMQLERNKSSSWIALSRQEMAGPFISQEKTVNSTNCVDIFGLFAVFIQQDGVTPLWCLTEIV